MQEIENLDILVRDAIRTIPRTKKFTNAIGVILLAPPGAGKSELAQRLSAELGLTHLKIDELQHYLAPKAGFFENLDHVTSFALKIMTELAKQGYSSVLDRNINKKGLREKARIDLEAVGGQLVEIVINCPDELNLRGVAHDNVDISIGERQGHIIDRAFYEFKKAQVEPPIGEHVYQINCDYDETGWLRLQNFLKLKLGEHTSS
jgi:predicted kinase